MGGRTANEAMLDALIEIITHLYRRAEKAETRLHKARLELRRLRGSGSATDKGVV